MIAGVVKEDMAVATGSKCFVIPKLEIALIRSLSSYISFSNHRSSPGCQYQRSDPSSSPTSETAAQDPGSWLSGGQFQLIPLQYRTYDKKFIRSSSYTTSSEFFSR